MCSCLQQKPTCTSCTCKGHTLKSLSGTDSAQVSCFCILGNRNCMKHEANCYEFGLVPLTSRFLGNFTRVFHVLKTRVFHVQNTRVFHVLNTRVLSYILTYISTIIPRVPYLQSPRVFHVLNTHVFHVLNTRVLSYIQTC